MIEERKQPRAVTLSLRRHERAWPLRRRATTGAGHRLSRPLELRGGHVTHDVTVPRLWLVGVWPSHAFREPISVGAVPLANLRR